MNFVPLHIFCKISFNKNTAQLLLFAAGILVFGIVGSYFYLPNRTVQEMIKICESGKRPVSIALTGDLLIGGRKVWQQIVDDNYNPEKLLGEAYINFKNSDITFANFEGIITEAKFKKGYLTLLFADRTGH